MRSPLVGLCLLAILACSDTAGPGDDLAGTWDLTGYSDSGIAAATTGTAVFRMNGTFSIDGTLTFPGEPPDQLLLSGTWLEQGEIVTLTTGEESGRWVRSADGDDVLLTLEGSQPPTIITLHRTSRSVGQA